MGLEQRVASSEIQAIAEESIDNMAKSTSDKIVELNGGKPVNAVFVVGGGGKMPSYTKALAKNLGIAPERVAIRGKEVLTTVDFNVEGFEKDSLYVTPVGICTNYYTQKNKFIFVNVNNERIKLYDNNKLTVFDAIMQIGYPNEKLFPRRGAQIEFMVNGKVRLVRGLAGEGAVITLNNKPASLNTAIEQNDVIFVEESTIGEPASITLGQIEEFGSDITFVVNGKNIVCPRFAYVNGELKSEFYDIRNEDSIRIENFYTVEQLFTFLDLDYKDYDVLVNNMPANKHTKVYENFMVSFSNVPKQTSYADLEDDVENEDADGGYYSDNNTEQNNEAGNGPAVQNDSDDNNSSDMSDATKGNNNAGDTQESADGASFNTAPDIQRPIRDVSIIVNGTPVVLKGKSDYVLVDLFQFYDFDLSKPKGNIVILHNGVRSEYTAPLNDGDDIKIFWE